MEGGERLLDLAREWLPGNASEGGLVSVSMTGDGALQFLVDAPATRRARQAYQAYQAQLDTLNAGDTGGEITL